MQALPLNNTNYNNQSKPSLPVCATYIIDLHLLHERDARIFSFLLPPHPQTTLGFRFHFNSCSLSNTMQLKICQPPNLTNLPDDHRLLIVTDYNNELHQTTFQKYSSQLQMTLDNQPQNDLSYLVDEIYHWQQAIACLRAAITVAEIKMDQF